MKTNPDWTPLGCGFYQGPEPSFPNDFLPRLEHLDMGVEDVFLAWELVRLAGPVLSHKQQRALILLVLAVRFVSTEGSTRLPLAPDKYFQQILEELGTTVEEQTVIKELLTAARQATNSRENSGLAVLFGKPGDYRPLIFDHGCLYIQKSHVLEDRVAKNLRNRLDYGMAPDDGKAVIAKAFLEKAWQDVFATPPAGSAGKIELDGEQKKAVKAALTGRITIISGRPGSGKTSIIASILRVLARVGQPTLESIALTAPTGKAADRMHQAVMEHLAAIPQPGAADSRLAAACPTSLTLHRLLGYLPFRDRFRHNEHNPLSQQLIIVDESSMIDLGMTDQLLRSLQPGAQVIFLGDADQLPPIGTGAVLRDLCLSRKANKQGKVVVLKRSYRARKEDSAGKKILEVAAAINDGLPPTTIGKGVSYKIINRASGLSFYGVEHLEAANKEQLEAFWARWQNLFKTSLSDLNGLLVKEYSSGPEGFDASATADLQTILGHYESFRILCVTRIAAGGTGSEAVNNWFHYRWRQDLKAAGQVTGKAYFVVGEPVLVTRNDYHLRLFNGDSGLLLMVKPESHSAKLMAVFPRGGSFVAYPLETLHGKLDLAWATTVHKAQGSEYDHVAIMLPKVPVRPLTRELLYTAVTRAKKSVTFIGSLQMLESGVKRKIRRNSGLADML